MEKINKIKFKLNKIYYNLFIDKFNKSINFNFPENVNRWDLIMKIIKVYNFKSYLEIGCDDDYSFKKIDVPEKTGVDPYSGGNFKGTSDEFFLQNKKKFDCIFIDGLHEYDQVCKDLENSLNCINEGGIIFLHDALPANVHQQAVPRYKIIWNGDVWKSIVYFRTRNDCDIVTCKIDHGVSIVRKIPNKDLLNININNFKNLKFEDFYNNYQRYLRVIDYDVIFNYLEK